MSKLIPPRPRYRKERIWAGFPALAVFVLLFLARLLFRLLPMAEGAILPRLIAVVLALYLPIAVFMMLRGQGYTRVLRFHLPRGAHTPMLIAALPAMLCGSVLLSILCGGTDTFGNTLGSFGIAPPGDPLHGVLFAVVFALLPAVAEEIFFRGILMAEYERRGAVRAVIMSALLFSLCHFDIANLPAHLFIGALLAILLFATDSLLATVLLQLAYSTLALFGQRYVNALYRITGSIELFLFALILIFLISMTVVLRCAAGIYRKRRLARLPDPRRDVPRNVQLYTFLDALTDPPVLLCILISVFGFIFL